MSKKCNESALPVLLEALFRHTPLLYVGQGKSFSDVPDTFLDKTPRTDPQRSFELTFWEVAQRLRITEDWDNSEGVSEVFRPAQPFRLTVEEIVNAIRFRQVVEGEMYRTAYPRSKVPKTVSYQGIPWRVQLWRRPFGWETDGGKVFRVHFRNPETRINTFGYVIVMP
jgi:hypothetical protein